MAKFVFNADADTRQEVEIEPTIYREAAENGMAVSQFINQKFKVADPEARGTAFEQFLASAGLFVNRDNRFGIKPPSMKAIFDGTVQMQAGLIVRDATPASRLLFPTVALEAVENKLRADNTSYVGLFDSLVARTDTITGLKFEQPVLNFSRPEAARSQPIAQGAMPHVMLSITASDVTRKIPTFSLGMEITKEAQEVTSLDLVTLALTRQAEEERAAIIDSALLTMYSGDVDAGIAALSSQTAQSFDSTISANGVLTHKAWVKWLRQNFRKRRIDWVFCDLNAALVIENRTGKPTVQTDNPASVRIDALAEVANPAWQNVQIFLLEDGLLPANTILGIDSRYAMWKVESSTAEYSAVEEFVLRKTSALRFDMGYQYYRMFDEAFQVLTLTV